MFTSFANTLSSSLLGPIYSLKKRYIPLLLIYFAYGFQSVTAVTITFWEKHSLDLSAESFVSLAVWVSMPWTLKMIFGQLVDHVPIFGSRRKAYVLLGAVLLSLGYMCLMGLMMQAPWVMWIGDTFMIYLVALLLSTFGFMIQDVTADTMSTEVVDRYEVLDGKRKKRLDETVKKELALVQILGRLSLMFAGVFAAFLTGWLATLFRENPQNIMWVALCIPVISCIGVFFLQLESQKKSSLGIDVRIMGGGVVYAVFLLLMAFLGPLSEFISSGVFVPFLEILQHYAQEITFVFSLVLLSSLLWWILKDESRGRVREILLVLGALFVFRSTVSTGPGFTWWAIDVLGFDEAFFGYVKIIGAVVPLVLLWLIADFIASKPVKSVLLFLIIVGALFSLPEMALYYGVHDALGISPRFVALADTALDSPLVHISMIPMLAMIAYYAPAHSRGTWFALVASIMNLALTAGNLLTKYLNKIFVISREVLDEAGEVLVAQDYSQLGNLLLVKLLYILVIPLVAVLILLPKRRVKNKKKV